MSSKSEQPESNARALYENYLDAVDAFDDGQYLNGKNGVVNATKRSFKKLTTNYDQYQQNAANNVTASIEASKTHFENNTAELQKEALADATAAGKEINVPDSGIFDTAHAVALAAPTVEEEALKEYRYINETARMDRESAIKFFIGASILVGAGVLEIATGHDVLPAIDASGATLSATTGMALLSSASGQDVRAAAINGALLQHELSQSAAAQDEVQ